MENFGVTFEHSVNGTYGKYCEELVANLPSNYIAVGYRPPVAGEWFLRLDRHADRAVSDFECPRLILRPKPKMRTVTIEVEDDREIVAFSVAKEESDLGRSSYLYTALGEVVGATCPTVGRSCRRLDVK